MKLTPEQEVARLANIIDQFAGMDWETRQRVLKFLSDMFERMTPQERGAADE